MKRNVTGRTAGCRNTAGLTYGWKHIVYDRVHSAVVGHEKEMLKCLDLYKDELTIGECSRRRIR
jgi:hypothetical protein